MNPSNIYWHPPAQFGPVQSLKPLWNNDGFLINIHYPDPIQTPWYYGDGGENVYGRRELVYGPGYPETFAIQNVMPMTAGIPRFNPFDWSNSQVRVHRTVKF